MESSSAVRSNVVPCSELSAALESLRNHFNGQIEMEERSEVGQFLREACSSLQTNLRRVVESTSDENYGALVRPEVVQNPFVEAEYSEEESDSEDEFDEEGLSDQEAIKRVRELRREVRQTSGEVARIRSTIIKKAASLTSCRGALTLAEPEASYEFNLLEYKTKADKYGELVDISWERIERSTLIDNLRQLANNLSNLIQHAPEKVKILLEIMDTIEQDIQQSSQIERAILSRDNEVAEMSGGIGFEKPRSVRPEVKLGLFLKDS